jgi:hypothetical protein
LFLYEKGDKKDCLCGGRDDGAVRRVNAALRPFGIKQRGGEDFL